MLGVFRRLGRNDRGAVAPIAAISLVGLIAAGGLAVDYARLAALDTELQQAADLAALAAATQLDRGADSQTRATAAISSATAANRLASNLTKFANDDAASGLVVELQPLVFCEEFDDSVADNAAACEEADAGDGAASRYVMVTTQVRTANYALTPIVAAFSGTLTATAVAGVESSICNVAPLLVCAPNNNWPTDTDIGKGIVLKPFQGPDSWAPGNYGLLDFGNGSPAVIEALMGHGLNGCQNNDDGATEPGTKEVTDAINTRMDVYEGNTPLTCDETTGAGCPAANSGKDMVLHLDEFVLETTTDVMPAQSTAEAHSGANCPSSPVLSNKVEFKAPDSPVVGWNRDTCHYSEDCDDGNIGDGVWNAAAYFDYYHGGDASAALAFVEKESIDELTRYDVYRWENDSNGANMPTPKRKVTIVSPSKKKGSRYEWTVRTQCSYPAPVFGSTGYPEQKDRRILPIVAADCTDLGGKGRPYEDYVLLRVFDIFLTEPSEDRDYPGPTEHKEIYGEIVGPAVTAEGGGSFQYYSRNRPYLVR